MATLAPLRRRGGRPKGSKDGPRPADAPPRGRPKKNQYTGTDSEGLFNHISHGLTTNLYSTADDERQRPKKKKTSEALKKHNREPPAPTRKNPWTQSSPPVASTSRATANNVGANTVDEYEAFFTMPHFTEEELDSLDHAALEGPPRLPPSPSQPSPSLHATTGNSIAEDLRQASQHTFFSKREVFMYDAESEDEGMESQNEADETMSRNPSRKTEPVIVEKGKAWFKQPKGMPTWLYEFFRDTVQPLLFEKSGRKILRPAIFCTQAAHSLPSFWLQPEEPVLALEGYRFDPPILFRPRVFFWLPHFSSSDSCFYIISWAYYCRDSCKSYFHGWSDKLLNSLPAYLRLAFPAILSRKTGLSKNVLTMLRSGNQHKMGPSGVHAMLYEMHTLRYNTLLLQYLESAFEQQRGVQMFNSTQSTLHPFSADPSCIPPFGDFADPQRYAGFVPSVSYLTSMMNKAIERDEPDADQHTSCLSPDQADIDDSHKIIKHIANEDGVPIFGALWTCMTSRYIRAEALTLTKSHEERIGPLMGIAASAKRYGLGEPLVAYSDDPIKDKAMLCTAFPSLAKDLTPMAAAHGLNSLTLPTELKVVLLDSMNLIQDAFLSLVGPLDSDNQAHICASLDAEWNISRRVGVSVLQIAPHSHPSLIYIIPVHKLTKLPASFLRFLISKQVFLIGSSIQADLTRLKKQFSQLDGQAFNIIDLKQFAIQRGLIQKKDSGALDTLAEKFLGVYLSKDPSIRKSEDWEKPHLSSELINYAALDVYASRLIFEKLSETAPLDCVRHDTAPGTRIALLTREGGEIAAYGRISSLQAATFTAVRVKTSTNSRVIIDIESVLIPSAAAILHVPHSSGSTTGTKAGAFTLSQLRAQITSPTFSIVTPVALLQYDRRCQSDSNSESDSAQRTILPEDIQMDTTAMNESSESEKEEDLDHNIAATDDRDLGRALTDPNSRSTCTGSPNSSIIITESSQAVQNNSIWLPEDEFDSSPLGRGLWDVLNRVMNSPADFQECYTRIKKDIFHAFHMIPLSSSHGLRAVFLRTLRDHLMRWDPIIRARVDETCRKVFKIGFDLMLLRNPRYIKERTPRYVPPPSVLVPAIQHVYNIFGNARDAESGQPLFNKTAWQKANAVLELAREGYLSDPAGVVLYEKAGIDENGLQKWKCKRGTNKLEGGPHGDIYRKFGALHDSYAEWMNADLYERSTEKFGVCAVPESLRIRLEMELYNDDTAQKFKLNANNDWLRRRQGVALPILPPTTSEARQYFFSKIGSFVAEASANGRRRINYVEFAKEWNRTADGKTRHYVTSEVLSAYAKTWEKTNNARASQELIEAQIDMAHQTTELFQTPTTPFPDSLKGVASSAQPQCGVVGFTDSDDYSMLSSLSVELATSHPRITPNLTVEQPNPNHRRDANSSHLSLQDCAPSKPHSHSGLAVQNSTLASTSTINPPGSRRTGPPNSPPPVPSSYDTQQLGTTHHRWLHLRKKT
ncbi:hypothetical protein FB451DRAFT_1172230 [Mycena latifolia]|nr:hypothetical protein FB451DRAFT_1172230 [Mycena latifolia]